ncbi:MAG: carboxypeptidase regulatory-like domain-containing protein [Kofleriaceae bacterium]
MRNVRFLPAVFLLAAAAGCARNQPRHVDGGVLGRVVIYRNGVAFYERAARVENGQVTVRVPRDKVDDFLKSLTVVERTSNKRLAVTIPRREANDGSYLSMTLELPEAPRGEVMLTYVTEAPAWKPSYRVVVGEAGKVMLEGWAIVDNTTSEDWKNVLVGVGASSALAFRYDLWSVRQVDRDLLAGEERFAIAPPTGVSPYQTTEASEQLAELDTSELRETPVAPSEAQADRGVNATTGAIEGVVTDKRTSEQLAGVTITVTGPALVGALTAITDEKGRYRITNLPPGTYTATFYYDALTLERGGIRVGAHRSTPVFQKLSSEHVGGETITISANAPTIDPSSTRQGITINNDDVKNIPTGRTFSGALGASPGSSSGAWTPPRPNVARGDAKLAEIAAQVRKERRDVVIEVHGQPGTEQAANARGTAVKNKLVNDGLSASRIRIVPKIGAGESDAVRVLAVAAAPGATPDATTGTTTRATASADDGPDTPVGESHFTAERPMTVRAGTSAMVAMVHGETTGGVVYLYDPISERGHQRYAFKSVRIDNPTGDTLEPGPVTVYGEGRFIGEGITEPVPPHASVVVPFALDRQIVVSREGNEQDRIARLVVVEHGVLTAELQHRRESRFTVTSRLPTPSKVYLRHRIEAGWTIAEGPDKRTTVGDSQLFEVELGPRETRYVKIAEATPVQRTLDLSSDEALGLMKVYIDDPETSRDLRAQIDKLLATHRGAADLVDKIETLREQLAEYRRRSGELHAQIVTLKAVRSGGELMTALRGRLSDMSNRTQKATLDLVDTQERLMLARVKFQNQLADLRLTDATAREASATNR